MAADLSPAERRGKRLMGLAHLAAGFVGGKLAVGLVQRFTPGATETVGDEGLLLAGSLASGYKATRGGKYMNLWAGASLAMAAPTLEAIADRAMAAINGQASA